KLHHDQGGVQVSLSAKVPVDVFRELAVTADVAWRCVKLELGRGRHSLLAGKPAFIVRRESLAATGKLIALIEPLYPIRDVEPQELADIRPGTCARSFTSEQCHGCNLLDVCRAG